MSVGPRLVQLANRPLIRRLVVVTVGLAFFVIGSAYLNLARPQDMVVLKIAGGEAVRAGLPATFRVVSSWADRRASAPVEVTDARIDGTSRLAKASPGSPALVTVDVPPNAGDEIALALDIETEGRQETLHIKVPVRHMSPEPALPEVPATLPKATRAHRVYLRPEAGVLASGMVNDVFVRVRSLTGEPVRGASVRLSHKSLPSGAIERVTEGSGLVRFPVDARQPSFRFGVDVRHEGETTSLEELLVPVGRQMLLSVSTPVSRPEVPITATLTTWRDDAEVFCDLVQGEVLLWSQRFSASGSPITIALGPWPEGRYSMQCCDHPWAFGEAFATTPILVSDAAPLDALLTELRDQQTLHPSGLVSPPGTDKAMAAAYWRAILRDDPVEPTILLSTRTSDLDSREAAHTAEKTRLLVSLGLVFLLVLAWMAETILKNILETRDRLRVYALESLMDDTAVEVDDMMPAEAAQRATLLKTRGLLIALVFVGAIIANVAGVIWLFAIIR